MWNKVGDWLMEERESEASVGVGANEARRRHTPAKCRLINREKLGVFYIGERAGQPKVGGTKTKQNSNSGGPETHQEGWEKKNTV